MYEERQSADMFRHHPQPYVPVLQLLPGRHRAAGQRRVIVGIPYVGGPDTRPYGGLLRQLVRGAASAYYAIHVLLDDFRRVLLRAGRQPPDLPRAHGRRERPLAGVRVPVPDRGAGGRRHAAGAAAGPRRGRRAPDPLPHCAADGLPLPPPRAPESHAPRASVLHVPPTTLPAATAAAAVAPAPVPAPAVAHQRGHG